MLVPQTDCGGAAIVVTVGCSLGQWHSGSKREALVRQPPYRVLDERPARSTRPADAISVFAGSEIVQQGTFEKLAAASGFFAYFARRQPV
jgi:hypothetical protein